ncbi:MAG: phosphoribosylaminoimidazolesuccinocarboxamide synthase [Acidobacteriia bacterium]|jgi:phosphoribosylaminoimidazole-succinocarboxamide synthase|nr:phosphoribosylaminoimidazolesuccinocarboxamide synthase [Terriglobia bacterium]
MNLSSVHTEINLPDHQLLGRGKVRDIYEVGDQLLIITSDRISAFDYVLDSGIPNKGKILTQMSLFWFEHMADIVSHHLISHKVEEFPNDLHPYADVLSGRSMLVKKAKVFPVECVVRGYLAGSGWKEYQNSQSVCGISLPTGLLESSRLTEPLFTPSTKATTGHDENISFKEMTDLIGTETAMKLREISLAIYKKARDYAGSKGIIIADTKFEFGTYEDEIILIDEVLTPDSSRFWPSSEYEPGKSQNPFDKQFIRDYLEEIRWNKQPPAPSLPDWVIEATSKKYLEAFELLTERRLEN